MTSQSVEKRVATRLAPDVRRRQIVTEATRLISISGFNAVSLEDIAKACGIRGPSVLHYFGSMHELLAAVLAHRDEIDSQNPPPPETLATPESTRAFFRTSVERNLERPQIVRLYAVLGAEAIDPGHPAHEYFAQREQNAYDGLELALEWKSNPALAARELMSFWTGLERQWVMNPSIDFTAVWDYFADRFFVADEVG